MTISPILNKLKKNKLKKNKLKKILKIFVKDLGKILKGLKKDRKKMF